MAPSWPYGAVSSTFLRGGVRKAYRSAASPRHPHPAEVIAAGTVALARPELSHRHVVELVVGKCRAVVADRASCGHEVLRPEQLRRRQRPIVALEEPVPRRVVECELRDVETGDRVARVGKAHPLEPLARIRLLEEPTIAGDLAEPPHQRLPDLRLPVVADAGKLVPVVAPHLRPIEYREERERRQ